MEGEGKSLGRRRKFRPEPVGLKLRPISQVAAANPGRESKKILDQGRRTGLSTRRVTLEHDCLAVLPKRHRRRAPSPAGPAPTIVEIAEDFVFIVSAASGRSKPGDLAPPRAGKVCASGAPVAVIEAGRSRLVRLKRLGEGLALFVFKFDEAMGDVVLGQEIIQ